MAGVSREDMAGMNFIRRNLAVCGLSDIGPPSKFLEYGFNAHLQCAPGFDTWLDKYVEVRILHFEDAIPIPGSVFGEAQEWLSYHWENNDKTLISCTAGESRSVSMAIGLLYLKEKVKFIKTCHEVCSRVVGAYPHPAILSSVANHCHATLELDQLRGLYASIEPQPPFPWTDELLMASLKQSNST